MYTDFLRSKISVAFPRAVYASKQEHRFPGCHVSSRSVLSRLFSLLSKCLSDRQARVAVDDRVRWRGRQGRREGVGNCSISLFFSHGHLDATCALD